MINEIAYAAQSRYAALVDGWRSIFVSEIMSPGFSSSAARSRLGRRAWTMAHELYHEAERGKIDEEIKRVSKSAQDELAALLTVTQRDELRSALSDHQDACIAYLRVEIEMILRLDIITLKQRYLERVIDVSRRSRLRAITERQALIEVEMTRPQIGRRDSAGRLFSSDIITRNAWRLSLMSVRNEAVMQAATILGKSRVKIVKPTPKGIEIQGYVSLDGMNNGIDYDTARRQFFHPNSNVYLEIE